jgi:quinol monooxygenase YgiN
LSLRRPFTALLLAAQVTAAAAQAPAPSQPLVATDRVAYFETAPAEIDHTIVVLKAYRQGARSAAGIVRLEVLQQIGRPNLFAIVEKWSDGASLQMHLASADNKKLREELQSALISPFDERLLAPVTVQPAAGAATDQSIYVLTHADSVDRSGVVTTMLQNIAAGARRESGNLLFDITVQPNRTNHFTLIEIWATPKAHESHIVADPTRKFRSAFGPVSGALYDERIYRIVK